MTNHHVLENAEMAGASRIEFNFQDGPDGRLQSSVFINFDSSAFFVTDSALDFSIVALKGDLSRATRFGWNGLSSAEGKLIVGEFVTIIQHPSGERKQIALRENQVIDVLDDFVHYKTDTSPGSSGSPVYNDQWEIVALHHSGVPKKDAKGNTLARDGSVWTPAMGEDNVNWIANEGVRISKILARIKSLPLSGSQAALRKQLIESEKGWVGDRSGAEGFAEDTAESTGATRTITGPFQLTISVGESPKSTVESAASESVDANSTSSPAESAPAGSVDELVNAWQQYGMGAQVSQPRVGSTLAEAANTPSSAVEWLTAASQ
jgi:endonuclease G